MRTKQCEHAKINRCQDCAHWLADPDNKLGGYCKGLDRWTSFAFGCLRWREEGVDIEKRRLFKIPIIQIEIKKLEELEKKAQELIFEIQSIKRGNA